MAENQFQNVMDSLMKGMDTVFTTKTVVGEPTQIGDMVIVPLVDVSFGVGAGAGINGDKKTNKGGGGMGGKMTPSAVLVIKNGVSKIINVKGQDSMSKILDMVPDIIDKFTSKNEKMPADEEAIEIAFPDGTESSCSEE